VELPVVEIAGEDALITVVIAVCYGSNLCVDRGKKRWYSGVEVEMIPSLRKETPR
jgi:hypothetical protein